MSDQHFFQRFIIDDQAVLAKQIDLFRQKLEAAEAAHDHEASLGAAAVLGSLLTTARQEKQARSLLLGYLSTAEAYAHSEQSGWFWLSLATANQYLNKTAEADHQFSDLLAATRQNKWARLEHFALHHWGRCLVEQGRLTEAQSCFEQAFQLRAAMDDPMQASSRHALEAVNDLIESRPCAECSQIKPRSDQFIKYDHLRHFYSRYSDDLLTHNYHMCAACHQVWREDDCDYPADSGYFWRPLTASDFFAEEGRYLPAGVTTADAGLKQWVLSFNGYFDVGLFGSRYLDS